MNKLRVFTAFSGYDSQCLALNRLKEDNSDFDYELVGWSEIDKYAIQAHNALFPQWSDRNLGDISKVDWGDVPDFDLFTYSSPCQDFSNAGLQRGGEKGSGTRSSLLWECEKAIIAKRPKYCILENVKALVSKKFIDLFMNWCKVMEGYGYTNYWKVLNAKDYGVPQNRERVFLVSILNEGTFEFPNPFNLELRLKDILESNVEERFYLSDEMASRFVHKPEKGTSETSTNVVGILKDSGFECANRIYGVKGVGPALTRDGHTPKITMAGELNIEGWHRHAKEILSTEGVCTCLSTQSNNLLQKIVEPVICRQVGRNPDNPTCRKSGIPTEQMIEIGDGVSHCLSTVQKDNYVIEPKILTRKRTEFGKAVRKEYEAGLTDLKRNDVTTYEPKEEPTSNTLTTVQKDNMLQTADFRIRKLTPTECFRLMGVSDEDIQTIRESGVSNSQQYKMAGNSIVVDVLYYIFEQLLIIGPML